MDIIIKGVKPKAQVLKSIQEYSLNKSGIYESESNCVITAIDKKYLFQVLVILRINYGELLFENYVSGYRSHIIFSVI